MKDLHHAVRAAKQQGETRRLLEAALFMASDPLTLRELSGLAGGDEADVMEHLQALRKDYIARETGLEILLNPDTDEFQMRVRPEFAEAVRHLAMASELNAGTQRTLALIAVREPILQSDVVKFRNNKAYDHVHTLLEKGFIERKPTGRTFELRTTRKFFDYFGEVRMAAPKQKPATEETAMTKEENTPPTEEPSASAEKDN